MQDISAWYHAARCHCDASSWYQENLHAAKKMICRIYTARCHTMVSKHIFYILWWLSLLMKIMSMVIIKVMMLMIDKASSGALLLRIMMIMKIIMIMIMKIIMIMIMLIIKIMMFWCLARQPLVRYY